jgi:predicted RNA-binding Zn-ribbon protein involved in translation (DUF1610 family)
LESSSLSESAEGGALYPASAKSTAGCCEKQTLLEFENSLSSSSSSSILDDHADGGDDGTPVLPGHGEAGPGCGDRVQFRACVSCGHQFWVKRSCMMRECPDCFEKWAHREARFASWRLWTGSKRRCREAGWAWSACRVLAVVVSVPDRGQGLLVARDEAYDVARRHHLDGGLGVYHPFRQDETTGVYRLDGHVHVHMVVLAHGDVPQGGTDGDVVFKVLRDAEYGDFRGFRGPTGIRRHLHYLLTHCGVLKGRHALTWWGSMSYNKLPNGVLRAMYPEAWAELKAVPDVRCPRCGSRKTFEILEDGSVDPSAASCHCRGGHRTRAELMM